MLKGFHWSKFGALDQNYNFALNDSLHIGDIFLISKILFLKGFVKILQIFVL